MMVLLELGQDEVFAQPRGDLNADTAADFWRALAPLLQSDRPRVTIDLRQLTKVSEETARVVAFLVGPIQRTGHFVTVIDHDARWTYPPSS
jgi:anti-anti-sigma regulatory factor